MILTFNQFINENLNYDWLTSAISKEIKDHFKSRAQVPDKFEIEHISAKDFYEEELKRVREDKLDYYEDFSDEEIPLITDDVYASAYEVDIDKETVKIIDSFMNVEDFNYLFLKSHLIENKKVYCIADVYGRLTLIDNL